MVHRATPDLNFSAGEGGTLGGRLSSVSSINGLEMLCLASKELDLLKYNQKAKPRHY